MSKRKDARSPPGFCVVYSTDDGELFKQEHRTREDNDAFAESLSLMGIDSSNISKHYLATPPAGWMEYTLPM